MFMKAISGLTTLLLFYILNGFAAEAVPDKSQPSSLLLSHQSSQLQNWRAYGFQLMILERGWFLFPEAQTDAV